MVLSFFTTIFNRIVQSSSSFAKRFCTEEKFVNTKTKCISLLFIRKTTFVPVAFLMVLSIQLSLGMRFPTMWYVRPAKPQISLRIRAVWSEPLLVAMSVKLLAEDHLELLSLKGGCTGSSMSTLVQIHIYIVGNYMSWLILSHKSKSSVTDWWGPIDLREGPVPVSKFHRQHIATCEFPRGIPDPCPPLYLLM